MSEKAFEFYENNIETDEQVRVRNILEGVQLSAENAVSRGEIDMSDHIKDIEEAIEENEGGIPIDLQDGLEKQLENLPMHEMSNITTYIDQAIEEKNFELAEALCGRARQSFRGYYLEGRFSKDDENELKETMVLREEKLTEERKHH